MKVVIIDDEVEIGEILSYLIKKEGHEAVAFHKPEDALAMIPAINPHFIVCDFKMPGLNGLELFLKIKNQINCPFMILTGEPTTDPEKLKALGVMDVLFKPRDLKRVAQVVKDHFTKNNA